MGFVVLARKGISIRYLMIKKKSYLEQLLLIVMALKVLSHSKTHETLAFPFRPYVLDNHSKAKIQIGRQSYKRS